jgi:hypothetical protein
MTADNIQDDSASRKGRDETNDREEQFRRWAHPDAANVSAIIFTGPPTRS